MAASHKKRLLMKWWSRSAETTRSFGFGAQLLLLNSDRKALGIVSFCAFGHRIIPVCGYLNGVSAFWYAGC